MPNTIQFKRGAESGIPTLLTGEPGWTTDAKGLHVGTGSANVKVGPFDTIEAENKEGADVDAGQVVAGHSSGSGFNLCDNSGAGAEAVGLAVADIADGVSGFVQTGGVLTLPDWTAATGGTALTARALYFADPATPGLLTTTRPTAGGERLQIVGVAIGPQSLMIGIEPPILL